MLTFGIPPVLNITAFQKANTLYLVSIFGTKLLSKLYADIAITVCPNKCVVWVHL